MRLPPELSAWLAKAPTPVALSIGLSALLALGGWVWTVAGDVQTQQTQVAVAVTQAQAAHDSQQSVEARLQRIEGKLDRLVTTILRIEADHEADHRHRQPEPQSSKEKNR